MLGNTCKPADVPPDGGVDGVVVPPDVPLVVPFVVPLVVPPPVPELQAPLDSVYGLLHDVHTPIFAAHNRQLGSVHGPLKPVEGSTPVPAGRLIVEEQLF